MLTVLMPARTFEIKSDYEFQKVLGNMALRLGSFISDVDQVKRRSVLFVFFLVS